MCGPTPPDRTIPAALWDQVAVAAHLHADEATACPHPGSIVDCPRLTGCPR